MRLFFALIVSVLAIGCTGYQHVSSPVYAPLNNKKGEAKINLDFNNVQAGYAFSDKLSVFATGFIRKNRTSTFDKKEGSGDLLYSEFTREVNLGLGYYTKRGNLIYELLAGVGTGSLRYKMTEDFTNEYRFDLHAHKAIAFLQPDVGINLNNKFELGLFTRFGLYRYYVLDTDTYGTYSKEPDAPPLLNRNTANFAFAEPGLVIRAGGEMFKFQAMFSHNFKLSQEPIRYRKVNVHLGFFFNFDAF